MEWLCRKSENVSEEEEHQQQQNKGKIDEEKRKTVMRKCTVSLWLDTAFETNEWMKRRNDRTKNARIDGGFWLKSISCRYNNLPSYFFPPNLLLLLLLHITSCMHILTYFIFIYVKIFSLPQFYCIFSRILPFVHFL